jgi:serine O-acetyltransferase
MNKYNKHPINVSIGQKNLIALLHKQLSFFYVENSDIDHSELQKGINVALDRTAYCFTRIKNKYYKYEDIPRLDPCHTGQYTIFLYFLANSLYNMNTNEGGVAASVYALNKMLHCVDIFYEVNLPDIFYLDHPIGTVIGKALFSDYFQFRQGCTIGNNHGNYPRFGKNVQLWSNVVVIGDCDVGDNVIFSADTFVKDETIPSDSVVFGKSPNIVIKSRKSLKRIETHFLLDL